MVHCEDNSVSLSVKPDLVIQRKAGLSSLRQALSEARERLGVVEPVKGEEEECALFNARTQPVSGQWDDTEEENVRWTDVSGSPKYVIGTDVCEERRAKQRCLIVLIHFCRHSTWPLTLATGYSSLFATASSMLPPIARSPSC